MSIVKLIGAVRGGIEIAMTGCQRMRSSRFGHPFRCMIVLVPTVPMPLPIFPMHPRFPRRMKHCEKMISMGLADIYGSIPEGFS